MDGCVIVDEYILLWWWIDITDSNARLVKMEGLLIKISVERAQIVAVLLLLFQIDARWGNIIVMMMFL